MPKKRKMLRNPNNYGSIKKLSGNRSRPYMVQVNPRVNMQGSYSYDVLGYYEEREEAMIALAEYNKSPFNLKGRTLTFTDVYNAYYRDKYELSKKVYSAASMQSTSAAYKNVSALHGQKFSGLRHSDLQAVVDSCPLKHASLELIVTLLKQMYAFAMREELVTKNSAQFIRINTPDDDVNGIRFSQDDFAALWQHSGNQNVQIILIYIYTGWRATELLEIHKKDISLEEWYMVGGKKTAAGKNRTVPIHPRIKGFVSGFFEQPGDYLFTPRDSPLKYNVLKNILSSALESCSITTKYTMHDTRHTFCSMLSDICTPDLIRDRLMGHSSKSLDDKVYIHKDIDHLREWVNKLP